MIDRVDSTSDHTQKGLVRNLSRTVVSSLDPSMKNYTASILKSTQVRTFCLSEIIFAHVRVATRVST